VIFLDIDGVLNCERDARQLDAQHKQLGHTATDPTGACFYRQIDREAVERVNRIAAATSAKIVVSSTWRKLMDLQELLLILTAHGLTTEIIGATPNGYAEPGLRALYGHPERLSRGYEIDYWLRQHPAVDRFVILDDGSDMVMHTNRLVQTDCEEGLCDEHVELAIRVLAWDGVSLPSPFDTFGAT